MVLFLKLKLNRWSIRYLSRAKNVVTLKYNYIPSTNCKIQILTPKYLDSALELTKNVYVADEKFCKAMKISKNPEAVKDWLELPKEIAKQGLSLIAVDQNTNKVSAVVYQAYYVRNDEYYEKILEKLKHPLSRAYVQFFIDLNKKFDFLSLAQKGSVFESVMSVTAREYAGKKMQHHLNEISFDLVDKLVKCEDGQDVVIDGTNVFLTKKPEIYIQIPTHRVLKHMAEDINQMKIFSVFSLDDFEFQGRPLSDFLDKGEETKVYAYYKRIMP